MTTTTPIVSFSLTALTIRQDSSPACSDVQPYSKVNDLRDGLSSYRPFATYEPDFWQLDGNYKFLPSSYTDVHIGLESLSMSDGAGDFATPPVLTVTFGSAHDTDGIVLRFAQYTGDFASHITIAFYDAANALIRTDDYYPDAWEFQTHQAVTGFKKVIITFHSTNRPYRYLRVKAIEYGSIMTFSGSSVRTAGLIEEVDPSLLTLPYNELELTLHTTDPAFNMINPTGPFIGLQERQQLTVYMQVGAEYRYIGEYYLDIWRNASETEVEFKAYDALGLLERVQQLGGLWLPGSPTTVGALVQSIMTTAGLSYFLDDTLTGVQVSGWLPAGSCREALQHIAMAAGAMVTCSRSNVVRITPVRTASQFDPDGQEHEMTAADKGLDEALELATLVTAVELHAHTYSLNYDVESELFNGTLAVGTHTIVFDSPCHNLTVTGASVVSSGANYVTVTRSSSPGTVTVSGFSYTDSVTRLQQTVGSPSANTPPNIIKVTGATLVSSSLASAVLQRLVNYFGQRYVERVGALAPLFQPHSAVRVDTLYNSSVLCIVERMETDMSGGFIVNSEMRGIVVT